MHRILLVVVALMLLTGSALAGTFTVTTTAQQDATLAVLVEERNAALAKQGKRTITVQEYVQIESTYILSQGLERARAAVKAAIMQAIETGDSVREKALRTTLGALK